MRKRAPTAMRRIRQLEQLERKELLAGDLVAQWRADDLNPTLDDQAVISNWVDAINSTDSASIGQPTLAKGAIGGRSAVRFATSDGVDGFSMAPTASPMSNIEDYTILVAFATSSQSLQGSGGDWYSNSGLVDANVIGLGNDWGVTMNAAGSLSTGVGGGFTGPKTSIYSAESGYNDGQLHVVAVTHLQANLSLYVDNQLAASSSSADAAARSRLGMAIGTTFTDPKIGFDGDIAEVRIYNGQLTAGEMTAVYNELNSYYNNSAPVGVADTYQFVEDAGGFDIFIPADQGVLANDTDAEGDSLTATLVETTQHGKLTFNPNGSFAYDSDEDYFGSDSFTYVPRDFRDATPITVTIQVTPAYDPAEPAADQYKLISGTVLNVNQNNGVLANDLNPDLATLSSVVSTPVTAGALTLNPNGSLRYDPQGFTGRATFGYQVQDGTGLSAEAMVTLIVNTPPVANNDSYAFDEDSLLSPIPGAGVTANDVDAEGDAVTATLTSDPANGNLVFTADGSFLYTPNKDFHGSDTFTYQLSDAEDSSNIATVNLTIRPVNDAPKAVADTYFTLADTPLQISAANGVLANDLDTEANPLTAALVTDVDQGSLTLNPNGSFSYSPPAGFTGVATFAYRSNDGQANSAPITVQIGINSLAQQQQIVINEVHVDPNIKTELVEFVELHNRSMVPIDLSGWKLDSAVDYSFPTGTSIAAGGYLVITENLSMFSSKFGRDAIGPWDGKLSNNGETVELWNATGDLIDEVDYQLGFPWPTTGDEPGHSIQLVNPQLQNDLGGNWVGAVPTPGAVNSVLADNAPPAMRQVNHSPQEPSSNQPVTITARVTDNDGVASVGLAYQLVKPGDYILQSDDRYNTEWTTVAMRDDGQSGDVQAGDGIYTAVLSADLQQHRQLVRYRISAADSLGATRTGPYADDPQPNFAYFVYDQIPSWTGAAEPGTTPEVTYSSDLLSSVPVYHLITTHENHVDSQYINDSELRSGYAGSDYRWQGTMVYDGEVYDHIGFRARGGVWRYAMGKNMWKFDFQRGHEFQASDEYGNEYKVPWDKLNFSAIIQQGNFLHRGEQGLFESVGFELFELAGTEAPETHYVQFRLITDSDEAGADQYGSDFQGLYLAIEQPDGNFLDEHDLPDGNFYKIENYAPESTVNQSATGVDDASDVRDFISDFRGRNRPEVEWWRENLDLDRYYGYQAISQAIHHYDTAFGKNYYYYFNTETNKWQIQPWDLDLTWADNMFGDENHDFNTKVARNPDFNNYVNQANIDLNNRYNVEYQNRLRELMDLLYNSEQTGMLIDQSASIVYQPGEASLVDADRSMWDYNPINATSSRYTNNDKNATRYHFYDHRELTTNDFAGMIQKLKDYVVTRSEWMEGRILTNEENIPTTPTAQYAGPANFPVDGLTFESSTFASPIGATFAGMEWRIAAVTDPNAAGFDPYARTDDRLYEINATWESDVITSFEPTVSIPGHMIEPGGTYRVRVRMLDNDGTWSHWSQPVQFVAGAATGSELFDALRISEVNFNPHDASAAERAAGHTDNNDFEFIELANISNRSIDLRGASLEQVEVDGEIRGVAFDFSTGAVTQLAPGGRLVVTEDVEAFRLRYGDAIPVAGVWSGRLSNGSETITLSAYGSIIQQFTYDDAWHPSADGDGATLEIINVAAADLDLWNTSTAWRASSLRGGTPGQAELTEIPGDANRDGVFNSNDLVAVLAVGEYEDGVAGNSTWEEGDWNGDGDFTSQDIVDAFNFGAYVAAARPSVLAAAIDAAFGDDHPLFDA